MRKRHLNTAKKSRRLTAGGKLLIERSGASSNRTPRAGARKGAPIFETFLSAETSATKKIDIIRGGVRARVVDDMVEYLEVPKIIIFEVLHTPESTGHRLIKENRNLDPAASERVVRVADIARMAEETFGGRERATHWLKSANLALGGVTPLSMLDTESGAGEVRKILSSINYGGVL